MNAATAVRGNTLYLYGGAVEMGDAEVALDDVWALEDADGAAEVERRLVAELSAAAAAAAGGDHVESSDDEEADARERGGRKTRAGIGRGRRRTRGSGLGKKISFIARFRDLRTLIF